VSRGRAPVGTIALLVLAWGSTWPSAKEAVSFCPPISFAAIRFTLAGLMVGALALTRPRREGELTFAHWWRVAVVSTFFNVGSLVLSTLAVARLSAGLTSLLVYVQPPVLALAQLLIFRVRLPRVRVVGIVVGFGGVALTLLVGSVFAKFSIAGLSLAVGAGVLWALGTLWVWRAPAAVPRERLVATQFLIAAGPTALAALLLHPIGDVRATPFALLIYLASAVALSVGWLLFFHLIVRHDAVVVSATLFFVPITAVVLSWVFLGEVVPWEIYPGGLLVLASVYLVRDRRVADDDDPVLA
jgi:drug/metabolite transporter (DMT)-like permease